MGGGFGGSNKTSGKGTVKEANYNLQVQAAQAAAAQAAAEAETKRLADVAAADAAAKVKADAATKAANDLKLGKGKKKRTGGNIRTDYHTGLGSTEQADIASKSLLGQ